MKKIAVIGAGDFQDPLIRKAKEMGYETHVFAWKCGDIGEKTADFFYPVSIREKERILTECRRIGPEGVCSIASDLAVGTVGYVARALGLTSNSGECDRVCTDKYEMREALARAGIRTPRHLRVTEPDGETLCRIREMTFPVIVKPVDRSGSRGVTKLESGEGLREAVSAAIEPSFAKAAIVEEFLEGKEYSCECISHAGRHRLLAVTEKFTTGEPHYIEVGHIEPAPVGGKLRERIGEAVFSGLDALGIRYGASHPEIRIDGTGEISIIEIGARMGGDCIGSDLVPLSTGQDFVRMVIDVACGREPERTEGPGGRCAAVRFLTCEEDLSLLEAAGKEFDLVRASGIAPDRTRPVEDSSGRYGYFIVTDPEYEKIRDRLF